MHRLRALPVLALTLSCGSDPSGSPAPSTPPAAGGAGGSIAGGGSSGGNAKAGAAGAGARAGGAGTGAAGASGTSGAGAAGASGTTASAGSSGAGAGGNNAAGAAGSAGGATGGAAGATSFPPIVAMPCTLDGSMRVVKTPASPGPRYIGVGYGSLIGVSTDGVSWETVCEVAQDGDSDSLLRGIAQGDGKIFAFGGSGKTRLLLSYDGLHWEDHTFAQNWMGGLAFGNGVWVAVGGYGLQGWSKNGLDWPKEQIAYPAPNKAYRSLVFGGGRFVAYGDDGRRTVTVDGKTWTNDTLGNPANTAISWLVDRFYAAGDGLVQTSPDGVTWTDHPNAALGKVRRITHDGTSFWLYSTNGLYRAADGLSWQKVETTADANVTFVDVFRYGAGRFVGISYDYNAKRMRSHVSSDGVAWTKHTPLLDTERGFVDLLARP